MATLTGAAADPTAAPTPESTWQPLAALRSPDGRVTVEIGQFDRDLGRGIFRKPECGLIGYRLLRDGTPLTEISAVGLELAGAPRIFTGLNVVDLTTREVDESYRPLYGEHAAHPAAYTEAELRVAEANGSRRAFTIRVRAYDGCAALRYELPRQDALEERIAIATDTTEFRFPEGTLGYECLYHEDEFRPRPLHEFLSEQSMLGIGHPGAWAPVTVTLPDGRCVAIAEANLRRASQMCLKPRGKDALVASQVASTQHDFADGAYESPWRLLVAADSPVDLIGRSYHLEVLCPPADPAINYADWVHPGTCIRETTLSNRGARRCIDFAAETGLRYILFDAGWYGAEPDENADLTKAEVDIRRAMAADANHDGFDLQQIIDYGQTKGVGIFLYVNHRLAEAQLDRALPVWQEWGVAGIKLGFVHVGPAEWTDWLLTCIEKCAAYQILVDIHDAYRPTGLTRTYPNLLTQEGIRGNEHMPTARHNVTLPFTRFTAGAGDYTLCFDNERQQTTNAHQLAMGAVYYSPLQVLYWYSKPDLVVDVAGREFWDDLPAVWDETRGLAGEIGEYVVVARRSGDTWYLGAMTGEGPRKVDVPLTFLGEGEFTATIFTDDPAASGEPRPPVQRQTQAVTRETTLSLKLLARGGAAAKLTTASSQSN